MKYFWYALALFLSFLFSISSIQAKLTLSPLFSDHVVLQRGIDIPVWGGANPGDYIQVNIDGKNAFAIADENGKWLAYLPSFEAGGPFILEVTGPDETLKVEDVLFGEVWLCGGQSNMEYTLTMLEKSEAISNSTDNQMRFITIDHQISTVPLDSMKTTGWKISGPSSSGDFSAVGYFFGQKLRKELNVPVGLISSNWGGTVAETWLSPDAAGQIDYYGGAIRTLLSFDPKINQERVAAKYRQIMEKMGGAGGRGIRESVPVWADPNLKDQRWGKMKVPGLWEMQGYEELNGVVWFRQTFTVDNYASNKEYWLSLGKIDDSDRTWINGELVGEMEQKYNKARYYKVPAGLIQEGENVLTVRVHDTGGGGGFWSDENQLFVSDGEERFYLAGKWKFRIDATDLNLATQGSDPNLFPTLLFNGMIHPLIPYGMKGVIWYQGESNAGRGEEYQNIFPILIKDWRKQFEQNLSFYFVQLANFGALGDGTQDSPWAEVREAQLMALEVPQTGMAVTIDIGEGDDIHPHNKEDVGLRLALNALAKDYGKEVEYSGPIYKSMREVDGQIYVEFDHADSGLLMGRGKERLIGFTIAGKDQKFYPAKAIVQGKFVVVSSDLVPNPVAVRYAWADNPGEVNLYNRDRLPASPFRTDKWDLQSKGNRKTY